MNTEITSTQKTPVVPWGARELIYAAAFAGVSLIGINLIILALDFILHMSIKLDSSLLGIFLFVQSAILLSAVWLFGMRRYQVGWDVLGWRRFDVPVGCATSIGALIASYAVNLCYAMFMLALGVKLAPQEIVLRFDLTGFGIVISFVLVALLAPVVEETFFRSFVYGGLRARFGARYAMLISAIIFALLHFSLDRLLPIIILGWVLAWLYEQTGSLVPGVIMHATNNALALAVYLLAKSLGVPLP